jgi:hypothetical protein
MAMESAEQRACVEDIREFLSDVTILIQQEGEKRQHGGVNRLPVKFLYLLAGPEAAMKTMEDRLLSLVRLKAQASSCVQTSWSLQA